ncbi:MAG: hypothetical protein ACREK5_10565 [Gemmatimonadota bacterium]
MFLDVIGALVVLWGVAGLSDAALQKQVEPLMWGGAVGRESVKLLRAQRRKAPTGAVILAVGFLLQLIGQARAS